MLTRRQLLVAGGAGLLGPLAWPRHGRARQAGIVRLTDRLSVVTTAGTNVVVLAADGGLVLVDTGEPGRAGALMAAVRELAPAGRVASAFNTHWHPANTGANEALREAGAAIRAHENTRVWMATPTWIPAEDRYRPARLSTAHPTDTFRTDGSIAAGGERIGYGYLIEAHTSSDIYVHFRESNVIAAGDVVAPARDPELDYFTGAWLGGRVDAMTRLLELCDDRTRLVPGFGPVIGRAELQAERDMMKTIYDRAFERVRQGDDADDMLKGGVMSGLARTWTDPRKFLYDVNKGLWAHHNKLSPDVV
jgi:glyoxylase-like metal-dependent hydrolase (beta-lactamase superfamily II)